MQLGNVAFYFLGAFTFWPLVGFAITYWLPPASRYPPPRSSGKPDANDKPRSGNYLTAQNNENHLSSGSLEDRIDLVSDAEASGWIRVAVEPISHDSSPETSAENDKTETFAKSARKSLRKLVGNSSLFGPSRARSDSSLDAPDDGSLGSAPASSATSVYSVDSLIESSESRHKTLAKCPRFWAVVRGGQLQLYKDEKERKLVNLVSLPKHVVMLWPQKMPEYELFYKRHPIVLINVTSVDGLVQLNLTPDKPPKDALYLYTENPSVKEDFYFALIKESTNFTNLEESELEELQHTSLGPRDPTVMARPIRSRKTEVQKLQSLIWSSDTSNDSQWLNALLGRLFFAVKDSPGAEDYLRHKFTSKLAPISRSSNIIGDIQVRSIFSGDAAPVLSNIRLLELTPEGSLRLAAQISYSGRFRVNLGTSVRLAAVTSLTTAEIPVELAATVKTLSGTLELRIKPPPSERIWYAFQSMPNVDLEIEPVVYDKQISFAVVTKFIRGKILDSLRETLVLPMMDDFAFYSTENSFFRGGIWESPNVSADVSSGASIGASIGGASTPNVNVSSGAGTGENTILNATRLGPRRETASSITSTDGDQVSTVTSRASDTESVATKSAFRSLGNWVAKKRSLSSLRTSSDPANDLPTTKSMPSLLGTANTSTKEHLDDNSIENQRHRRQFSNGSTTSFSPSRVSTTTTHVNTEPAAPTMPRIVPSSPSRSSARRKPVPLPNERSSSPLSDSSSSIATSMANSPITTSPIAQSPMATPSTTTPPTKTPPITMTDAQTSSKNLRVPTSTRPPSVASADASIHSTNVPKKLSNGLLDPLAIGLARPSADLSVLPTPATLVNNHTPTANRQRRASSISSLHSLIAPSETASVSSSHSSRRRSPRSRMAGPKLPPRRRTIQLQNVDPEEVFE